MKNRTTKPRPLGHPRKRSAIGLASLVAAAALLFNPLIGASALAQEDNPLAATDSQVTASEPDTLAAVEPAVDPAQDIVVPGPEDPPAQQSPGEEQVPATEPESAPLPISPEEPQEPTTLAVPATELDAEVATPTDEPLGLDQTVRPSVGPVFLEAISTVDPGSAIVNGSITNFDFTQHEAYVYLLDGNNQAKYKKEVISAMTGTLRPLSTFTNIAPGTYRGCVQYKERFGTWYGTNCSSKSFTVKAAPQLLQAAFDPSTIQLPVTTSTLSGSVANWIDGYTLRYELTKGDVPVGSGTLTIANGTYSTPISVTGGEGTYIATITLSDPSAKDIGTTTATLQVTAAKPVITSFAFDPEYTYAGDYPAFVGNADNVNPQTQRIQIKLPGTCGTWLLDFEENGTFGGTASPGLCSLLSQPGEWQLTARVAEKSSGSALSDPVSATLQVRALPTVDLGFTSVDTYVSETSPGTANLSADFANTYAGQSISVTVTKEGSDTPLYEDVFDGASPHSGSNTISLTTGGTYTATVTIKDGDRVLTTETQTITTKDKPVITSFGFDPAYTYAGDDVVFAGHADNVDPQTQEIRITMPGACGILVGVSYENGTFSGTIGSGSCSLLRQPGERQFTARVIDKSSGLALSDPVSTTLQVRALPTVDLGFTSSDTYVSETSPGSASLNADFANTYAGQSISVTVTKEGSDTPLFETTIDGDTATLPATSIPLTAGGTYTATVTIKDGDRVLTTETQTITTKHHPSIASLSFDRDTDWVSLSGTADAVLSGSITNYVADDFTYVLEVQTNSEASVPLPLDVQADGTFANSVSELPVGRISARLVITQDGTDFRTSMDTSLTLAPAPLSMVVNLLPGRTSLDPETNLTSLMIGAFPYPRIGTPFESWLKFQDEDAAAFSELIYIEIKEVREPGTYTLSGWYKDTRTDETSEVWDATAVVVPQANNLNAAWDNQSMMIPVIGQSVEGVLQGSVDDFDAEFYQVQIKHGDGDWESVVVDEQGNFTASLPNLTEGDYSTSVRVWNIQYDKQVGSELSLPLSVRDYAPNVTLSSTELTQGDDFTITGEGWPASASIGHSLHSKPMTLTEGIPAEADGTYSVKATIPLDAAPGLHNVVAVADTGHQFSVEVTVKAKVVPDDGNKTDKDGNKTGGSNTKNPPSLAKTGTDVAGLALVAIGLCVAGLWVRSRYGRTKG